jgi:hypothetical protein
MFAAALRVGLRARVRISSGVWMFVVGGSPTVVYQCVCDLEALGRVGLLRQEKNAKFKMISHDVITVENFNGKSYICFTNYVMTSHMQKFSFEFNSAAQCIERSVVPSCIVCFNAGLRVIPLCDVD